MHVGLYESAAALHATNRALETLTNNLAHGASPAYKKRIAGTVSFEQQLQLANTRVPLPVVRESIDFAQGTLTPTGNALDLAIDGKGFFKIETNDGIRYSRGGSFFMTANGSLMNLAGERLSVNGTLNPSLGPPTIDAKGQISQPGQASAASISIVEFDNLAEGVAEKGGLYRFSPDLEKPATGRISSGFVEQSNVSSVDALVGLVSLNRGFEASTRAMRTIDEATQRTTTSA